MKNFFLFSSILIVITLSSIFAGYENPGLVETPKKKIKYILKKIGLIDSFYIEEPAKAVQVIKKSEEDFFANSFSWLLSIFSSSTFNAFKYLASLMMSKFVIKSLFILYLIIIDFSKEYEKLLKFRIKIIIMIKFFIYSSLVN